MYGHVSCSVWTTRHTCVLDCDVTGAHMSSTVPGSDTHLYHSGGPLLLLQICCYQISVHNLSMSPLEPIRIGDVWQYEFLLCTFLHVHGTHTCTLLQFTCRLHASMESTHNLRVYAYAHTRCCMISCRTC